MKNIAFVFLFAACAAAEPQTPAEEAPISASLDSALAMTSVSVSIQTDPGTKLTLCGKANITATNGYLAGQAFTANFPSDFPSPYWGIDPATDAYVCLETVHYTTSTWQIGPYTRTGAYDAFNFVIYGSRTATSDWVGLEKRTWVNGTSAFDTAGLAAIYRIAFGANVHGGTGAVTFDFDAANENRCDAMTTEWEKCWIWEAYTGDGVEAFPAPRNLDRPFSFQHEGNNWVKYDAAVDSYTVNDAQVASALTAINFVPLFWIDASNSSFDWSFTL